MDFTFAAGVLMRLATLHRKRELQSRDGFLLVFLVWTILPAFATLPLLFHIQELTFTDAYFETVSGITTTGSTVLDHIDELPKSINFWRCELVWLGGMGLIVLAVAILPLLGVGGMQLYKAETPGPMKDSKLTPRITETAKGLWLVYAGITVACICTYRVAGMSWFDAINPPCAVCSVSLLERTSLSQTIWRSKHSCAPIRTSAVFAGKRASRRGFTGLPTIVFEKMRAAGRSLWELTKNNSRPNAILRWSILV